MYLRGLSAALLVVGLLALGACGCDRAGAGAGPPGAPGGLPPEAKTARFTPWPASLPRLRFAITPYDDRRVLEESYGPMVAWLGRRVGFAVDVQIAASYASVVEGLRDGVYDVALVTPLAYVEAKEYDPGVRLLASQVAEGTTTYLGYIYTRSDHPAQTLADLAGSTFCYVDPHSTSGFIYPRALLRQRGFDPDRFFGRTELGGNHGVCLRRVLAGEVDAAAISSGAVATARREGLEVDRIKVLAKTPRIPYDAWVASSRLPAAATARLREELLALSTRSPDGRSVLQGPIRLNAWMDVTDGQYDSVRAARALAQPLETAGR
jgi:phosphonate transport system substrate-binding protein